MECSRFKKLIKLWYIQVQDEAMAPARMVSFMKNHIVECTICLADPMVQQEVNKLAEIVIPSPKNIKYAANNWSEKVQAEPIVKIEETPVTSSANLIETK